MLCLRILICFITTFRNLFLLTYFNIYSLINLVDDLNFFTNFLSLNPRNSLCIFLTSLYIARPIEVSSTPLIVSFIKTLVSPICHNFRAGSRTLLKSLNFFASLKIVSQIVLVILGPPAFINWFIYFFPTIALYRFEKSS